MRVLVCGGRNYQNKRFLFEELDMLNVEEGITMVIEGGASGADNLAFEWARSRYKPVITHFADWASLGVAAGPIRNAEMLQNYAPDLVIAFPGGKGTEDMVNRAKTANVEVKCFLNSRHKHEDGKNGYALVM